MIDKQLRYNEMFVGTAYTAASNRREVNIEKCFSRELCNVYTLTYYVCLFSTRCICIVVSIQNNSRRQRLFLGSVIIITVETVSIRVHLGILGRGKSFVVFYSKI